MQGGGAISAYAEALAARLSFDRALARAVRDEVEDHLRQAVSADTAHGPEEAQRRAIERFGDPARIAAQFAAAALAAQARKLGVMLPLVIAGVLLAMATRVAWYDLTQWELCENARELRDTLGLLDRSAFLLAVAGGFAGRISCAGRLHFWTLAAYALAASVACDGLLTALRLAGWGFSGYFLVPLASMAIEIACAALLLLHVRRMARRSAAAGHLLQS